ncbi:hypothetical protein EXIGLDRAFT_606575 [Exidia glandulosa HHB12029]|uniref:Microbial-type PARG catalytic domain-containing protein n=1 Tax=Exidia glandulosa HHB12029 TaxID=1314781 RepID=A0A165M5L4_EXIGL|nr:hypothetical protein EXIGLDRAFT_606575 [Exidia glandulosa HHB12029]
MSTRTYADRAKVAHDTLARTDSIVASTPGASLDAEFLHDADLPPLTHGESGLPWPNYTPQRVRIVNSDSFTLARELLKEIPDARVAVLNLASDEYPGGGWEVSLSRTQEEALCYSSTLFKTLNASWYPWPNTGPGSVAGIFSPAVVVFKDDLAHDCADLPESERVVVSVLTVAAPRALKGHLSDSELNDLRGKIRLTLRMAARRKQDVLVLGAMGCGAYRCPPKQVSQEMRDILKEEEFKGWFRLVTFAVFSKRDPNFVGGDNFDVFTETFTNVEV